MIWEIKKLRKAKKLSRYQLSKKTGISQSAIQKLERGVSVPRIDTLCQLAYGLKQNPEDLFIYLSYKENFYKGEYKDPLGEYKTYRCDD